MDVWTFAIEALKVLGAAVGGGALLKLLQWWSSSRRSDQEYIADSYRLAVEDAIARAKTAERAKVDFERRMEAKLEAGMAELYSLKDERIKIMLERDKLQMRVNELCRKNEPQLDLQPPPRQSANTASSM